ncbi:MAG TPA: acetyl-CoA C-acetyltransferase [Candidatus Latescibacteria bacterium]|jgi:acetyl-CoA C-acetyltransferase|nr:acetyl-CoA C-acyltransferase [Gemmatimonadaceae bacterium]MDP6018313.1 acetyl-CoA C-acetyltransferase [Candidatus Latescibacterota bacterium]HJP29060.1 acetyl-CoA C-acetyltransferase [Candidatus Latescibacterota bacterium]
MAEAVIASAVRSAIGTYGGALRDVTPVTLGQVAVEAAISRSAVAAEAVNEVILGMIYQGGQGPNPARQAAVKSGVPYSAPAMTVNKMCGSGLKAIALAAAAVRSGDAQVVVAGGMESMSGVVYGLAGSRWGERMGHSQVTDLMIMDGLWDCFYDCHMGTTAENLASEYGISRQEQDRYALLSQDRYSAAHAAGRFADEIVPLEIPQRRGEPTVFDVDEHPRKDVSLEGLGQLRPAFDKQGTVTAGNASGLNDGAAAMTVISEAVAETAGIEPLARVVDSVSVGVDPRVMGIGPAPAIEQLLQRNDLTLDDIDLLEVNEAFAAQVLAVGRRLDWDVDRVNVNGGAIALGHPVGASGARVAVTLLHEMRRRQVRRGIAALCIGGGMGIAVLFEC